MTIHDYVKNKKHLTTSFLQSSLNKDAFGKLSVVNSWGNDAVRRILHLTVGGKMLRAGLIFLSFEMVSEKTAHSGLVETASALELIHTGLIIHDDVMDHDAMRRNMDSLHKQYEHILQSGGASDAQKGSESFAVCVGDLSVFLGFSLLSKIKPETLSIAVSELVSEELAKTSVAQMQDVYGGISNRPMSMDDIISTYAYKTGRYSCGLPLVLGAKIGNASDAIIKNLWELGTALGICYQITDDELNLFGNPNKTGKPVGSDIREGKQTLHRFFLMQRASEKEREKLATLFGNPAISSFDIDWILSRMKRYDISGEIRSKVLEKQEEIIRECIQHIRIPEQNKKLLIECIQYMKERKS